MNCSRNVAGIIRKDSNNSAPHRDEGTLRTDLQKTGSQNRPAMAKRASTISGASATPKAIFPATNDVPHRNAAASTYR
ncbi:hypothetical protein ALP29_201179 [Pseudomonas syringae pv. avii]|uniref:Uncharacterized protein n=1 Tax=Pseudomonas syringae pv. avii TaxID=663959 RepID=A0A3M5UT86_PSESX|nr:hypothetical protein ALP29_201179 [Pseudomonas syringae pv. avii]